MKARQRTRIHELAIKTMEVIKLAYQSRLFKSSRDKQINTLCDYLSNDYPLEIQTYIILFIDIKTLEIFQFTSKHIFNFMKENNTIYNKKKSIYSSGGLQFFFKTLTTPTFSGKTYTLRGEPNSTIDEMKEK